MAEHTPTPTLVMGSSVCLGPDDEEGIPYDEAVIHLEGDEDSEIEIRCPGALRLAPLIVKAVNSHEAMERLAAAAQVVLDGLNIRIDHAKRRNVPVPVFDGIAELAGALNALRACAQGE